MQGLNRAISSWQWYINLLAFTSKKYFKSWPFHSLRSTAHADYMNCVYTLYLPCNIPFSYRGCMWSSFSYQFKCWAPATECTSVGRHESSHDIASYICHARQCFILFQILWRFCHLICLTALIWYTFVTVYVYTQQKASYVQYKYCKQHVISEHIHKLSKN